MQSRSEGDTRLQHCTYHLSYLITGYSLTFQELAICQSHLKWIDLAAQLGVS